MSRYAVTANRFLQIMRVGGLMPLYSVSDVIGVSRATVEKRIKAGKLTNIEYKIENGPVRRYVLIEQVQSWIDERNHNDTPATSINPPARDSRY